MLNSLDMTVDAMTAFYIAGGIGSGIDISKRLISNASQNRFE
jgi:hypothetical protein